MNELATRIEQQPLATAIEYYAENSLRTRKPFPSCGEIFFPPRRS